jgi:hypothetical protein
VKRDGQEACQRINERTRKKLLEPAQEQAEVGAGSGEHGVDAIAIATGEIVAAHAVILLEVTDDG